MAMMNRNFLLSKIRPFISSFPKSHTFCSSSADVPIFPKIPDIDLSGIYPPTLLSEAKAAAKAWDAKMQLVRKAAGVKLSEANLHFSIYQATIQPPDFSKFSEAAACLAEKFNEAEALIAEGEARIAKGKEFLLKLKAKIKEMKRKIEAAAEALDKKKSEEKKVLPLMKPLEAERHFADYEAAIKAGMAPDSAVVKEIVLEGERCVAAIGELVEVVKERIKHEEASMTESKKQMAEIEVRAKEFEVLIAVMEAGVVNFKAHMAEMQARMAEMEAQIAQIVKQTEEFEAKIAVTTKSSASTLKTGIWERVRKFFL